MFGKMELQFCVLIFFSQQFAQAITNGPTNSYIHAPGKMLPAPFPPNSVKVTMNLTLNQCAAECSLEYHLKRFPCYAFEYAAPTKTCLLTNITTHVIKGGYLGLQKSSFMHFYERSKGAYLNLFQPIHNMALKRQDSYFAIFYNMTREKCALFCLLETRDTCMSFSYSETKQVCGLSKLFYTKENGQTLMPSSIYDHYQYFTTWPCNVTIPWNYSPLAIASPYFPYASLKDVNCHVVIEAPEGKQVDLQFSTFFTQRNICDGEKHGLTVADGPTASEHDELKTVCNSDNFVNRRFMSSSGYLHIKFSTGNIPLAFKAVYDFVTPDPCANSPCQHGGNCTAVSVGFTCSCLPGYTGSLCEKDVDECESSPCLFGGQCIDKINSFECVCPKPLGGSRCDQYLGLCSDMPCQNGAKCSPHGQDYICECKPGYTGKNCTEVVPHDPCDFQPCQNNGTCHSLGQTYSCFCVSGFSGDQCEINVDDCASNPCYFNVPCMDLVNDYRCECPDILSGKRCENFIGKCYENPCVHGQCFPLARDNYTCSCDNGFTGQNCTVKTFDFCKPNPCKHGSCRSYDNGPSCICDFDYEGPLCNRKINHCQDVDCHKGECRNLEGSFRCDCVEGFTGKFCNETVDHCQHSECGPGTCINRMTNYFCFCEDGKTGMKCESVFKDSGCSNSSCVHGTCKTVNGSSTCVCLDGYEGEKCDQIADNCQPNSCFHGSCISKLHGYTCKCDPGYSGTKCADVTDHCKKAGCLYGLCQNTINGFTCICAVGYYGDLCQYREGETAPTTSKTSWAITYSEILSTRSVKTSGTTQFCNEEPCINGVCSSMLSGHCNCYNGFTGQKCDIFIGCTLSNPCQHRNCSNTEDSYTCTCPTNYTGKNCEILIPDLEYSHCDNSTCMNNGTCVTYRDRCICPEGFTGDRCQYINMCQNNTCKNGQCIQVEDSVRCEMSPLIGHSNTSAGLPFLPALHVPRLYEECCYCINSLRTSSKSDNVQTVCLKTAMEQQLSFTSRNRIKTCVEDLPLVKLCPEDLPEMRLSTFQRSQSYCRL